MQDQVDAGTLPVREAYKRVREGKVESTPKPAKAKRSRGKKRKRGVELVYRTDSGAKIVLTFPRKVSESEIRSALIEVAERGSDAAKAA